MSDEPASATPFRLRPAEAADAEFVFDLHTASAQDAIEAIWGWSPAAQRRRFEGNFRPEAFQIVMLAPDRRARAPSNETAKEERAVGVCRIERDDCAILLTRLQVLPAFRNRGLASRLITSLRDEAHASGRDLRIRALRDERFRRFCERRGFVVDRITTTHMEMSDCHERDQGWMRHALREASRALEEDETPVGAVVVDGDRVVGIGRNAMAKGRDPTRHAEMMAIREACANLGAERLDACALYVTVEPCPMCAGAAVLARVARVVFGALNEKFGACGSQLDVLSVETWNHRVAWRGGVFAEESRALLRAFFERRRGEPAQRGMEGP